MISIVENGKNVWQSLQMQDWTTVSVSANFFNILQRNKNNGRANWSENSKLLLKKSLQFVETYTNSVRFERSTCHSYYCCCNFIYILLVGKSPGNQKFLLPLAIKNLTKSHKGDFNGITWQLNNVRWSS